MACGLWNPAILTTLTTMTHLTNLTNLTNLTTKKSNKNCDVRAVSHSCDVFFEFLQRFSELSWFRC